jgi:transposase-like protein
MEIELKDVEKHEKYMCVLRRYRCNECGGQITYERVGVSTPVFLPVSSLFLPN